MTRRPQTSIVASPVLVGATTVLVALVAVVLAYRANQGLPFVPTVDARVQIENAELLGKGSEVKEGGFRIGFVERVRTVRLADGRLVAEAELQLASGTRLPVDSRFVVRPRSPLGLKYLEVSRGRSERLAPDEHAFPPAQAGAPVAIDRVNEQFDGPTRGALRRVSEGLGTAFAARGNGINETVAELPRLLRRLETVAGALADPRTRLGRTIEELSDAARIVAPLATTQVEALEDAGITFEAISRDVDALQSAIERTHPALRAGTSSFRVQQPFLRESTALAREMRPAVRDLRAALPSLETGLTRAVPVLEDSPPFYRNVRRTLVELRELSRDPATTIAVRGLAANARTLNPQLRYYGPFQTVCNYWTYYWTYLGEHISQETPYGFAQRVLVKNMPRQTNSPASMGATASANGEGYDPTSSTSGPPVHFHGQTYGAAIDEEGNADCEIGQRGYPRRLNTIANPDYDIAVDPHTPGNQGPTYTGRARVPEGQTFSREPLTGGQHP